MPHSPLVRRARARRGLSVIEVLLALVLVSVGLLGMAGGSALALRSAGSAARAHRAARIAALRLASLTAAGCGRSASGVTLEDATGVRERWEVGEARNGAASLEVRVAWREAQRTDSLVLRSAMLC
jgi:Tfp pilus assembly protein PilV